MGVNKRKIGKVVLQEHNVNLKHSESLQCKFNWGRTCSK